MSRPPLISSIVAACLARSAGLWKPAQATSGPNSTREVAAAIAASIVQASHGPRASGCPGQRYRRCSPIHSESKPTVLDGPDHVEQLGPADLAFDLGQLDPDLERPRAHAGTAGTPRLAAIARR